MHASSPANGFLVLVAHSNDAPETRTLVLLPLSDCCTLS